nr:MAG TPA: hypothetical protein [Caudoviricetes sp.]
MGNIIGNVSGDESMEESVDFYERYSSLYNNIKGVLNADDNIVKLLLLYFPDKTVDYLSKFWLDIRDGVVNDYKICCDRAMGVKED